jgi:hypothetical protein
LHRLDELATQDVNKNAAVAAIKAAEGIADDNHAPGRAPVLMQPGITIVIANEPRAVASAQGPLIDINATPCDSETDGDYESRR